jgi:hypothetical protein
MISKVAKLNQTTMSMPPFLEPNTDVFGSRKGGIDIVVWFNLATFDIIGSLAFGESFDVNDEYRCDV